MVSQRGMRIRYLKSLDQNFPIKGLKYLNRHFQRRLLESLNRPVYRILSFDFMPIVNNLIILSNYFMVPDNLGHNLSSWKTSCEMDWPNYRWLAEVRQYDPILKIKYFVNDYFRWFFTLSKLRFGRGGLKFPFRKWMNYFVNYFSCD